MAAGRGQEQAKRPRSSKSQKTNPQRPQSQRTAEPRTRHDNQEGSPNSSSSDRLAAYNEKLTGISQYDLEKTIPALALRSFHLPGNESWCEDWRQYFFNNHPVLGLCCHHPLHPIRLRMRLVILLGSVVFGLACTNIIWLWFRYHEDETYFVFSIGQAAPNNYNGDTSIDNSTGAGGNANGSLTETTTNSTSASITVGTTYAVTKGMIVLWTVGGGLHACFDCTVWFLAACVCCLPGQPLSHLERYRRLGSLLVVLAVLLTTALSTLAVVVRAMTNNSSSGGESMQTTTGVPSAGLLDDALDLTEAPREASAYTFLIGYAVELALALVVYNPLIGTILLSGVLGCGKIPILGGRPYELECERREAEASNRQSRRMTPSSSSSTDPPV